MKAIRERLLHYGATSLLDEELLTLILGGSAETVTIIRQFLEEHGGLHGLQQTALWEFTQPGLRGVKAAQITAILELAKRLNAPDGKGKYQIMSAQDVYVLLKPEMAYLDHEELWVLLLDTKSRLVDKRMLYKGTINASVLRIAELLRPAIVRKCPNILICHNHPSGDPNPSAEDLEVTRQCVDAGKLLDIDLLDHIILGENRFVSLKDRLRW